MNALFTSQSLENTLQAMMNSATLLNLDIKLFSRPFQLKFTFQVSSMELDLDISSHSAQNLIPFILGKQKQS